MTGAAPRGRCISLPALARCLAALVAVLVLWLLSSPAALAATTDTWTCAEDNWSNTSCWSSGSLPDSSTHVQITSGDTVRLDVDATIATLGIPDGQTTVM